MQTEAVIEAAWEVRQENSFEPDISIMVPFVSTAREFYYVKDLIDGAAQGTFKKIGAEMDYTVGTMIETPRAALYPDPLQKGPISSPLAPMILRSSFTDSKSGYRGTHRRIYRERHIG